MATSFVSAAEYLTSKSTGCQKVPPKVVFGWLESCTVADISEFKKAFPDAAVYFCTAGPKDVVFMPAGFCTIETIKKDDFGGIKYSGLSPKDLPVLTGISRYLTSLSKSSQALEEAVTNISLHA